MIKSDKGMVEVTGGTNEVLADFTIIGKAIYKKLSDERGGKIAHKFLDDAFANIYKSEEEIVSEISDAVVELLTAMAENVKLRKELKGIFEED